MKHDTALRAACTTLVVAAGVGLAGCATTPLRTDASTSRIRAAEQAGAAQVPAATFHLQLARDQVESAKKLARNGDREQARSMLTRANADAELAVALSHEDAEKEEAKSAVERVRQLMLDHPAREQGATP